MAAPNMAHLEDRMDRLWILYLGHLDTYTAAQESLQRSLKSGFLSLSRANFSARSGVRYGKDYYHDRAISTRRVELKPSTDGSSVATSVVRVSPSSLDTGDEVINEKDTRTPEVAQQPSPPATPSPKLDPSPPDTVQDLGDSKTATDDHSRNEDAVPPKLALEADPIRWYGILVPSELRSAQASFSLAVEESVATAVNAGRSMRETETEIRKVRKEMKRAERDVKH